MLKRLANGWVFVHRQLALVFFNALGLAPSLQQTYSGKIDSCNVVSVIRSYCTVKCYCKIV